MEEGGAPELRSYPEPRQGGKLDPGQRVRITGAYVLAPRHLAKFLQDQCLWERSLKRDPTVHL